MSSSRRQYPFLIIEPKWQRRWEQEQTFRAFNPGEEIPAAHPFAQRHGLGGKKPLAADLPPKFYILDMFPYPSGDGLHVGHPEGYTATDILARYRRAQGWHVLHPMGWDAFGLPAEQYAIRTGQHPRLTTNKNIKTFKRQIQSLGFSYDWTREVDTTDPLYFRWTQWIFLQLYNSWFNPKTNRAESVDTLTYPPETTSAEAKRAYCDSKRLAFVTDAPVWWCEELGTVLANEEVVDGRSEVGSHSVVRRPMRQWMLRITSYAERLLADLDTIDWSDSLKEMQRNWIGRSEGAEVDFALEGHPSKIRVFTTRPDTLFGATYMVLAPEHSLLREIVTPGQAEAIAAYQATVAKKSDLERTELSKAKTGVFTGAFAINPVNGTRIPIWIADYVLATYGTGAIMAVPGHDDRDFEFAKKFDLPIVEVVAPTVRQPEHQVPAVALEKPFIDDGIALNSVHADLSLDGLPTPAAKQRITAWLEAKGLGEKTVNYKLRDWLFSRQRYWGEPFPIVWRGGRHEALPASDLPVQPPSLEDYKPTPEGQPPLARAVAWTQLPEGATRELNTMPQWAGSCWYYLRFLDSKNPENFVGREAESYWMGTASPARVTASIAPNAAQDRTAKISGTPTPGVDLYVGGTEHAVLHLLYARFWHKVLFDLGHVSTREPFFKLVNQGLILGDDGQKMSKSRGNVVNPDEILQEYGADAFRLYEMFMGPLQDAKPWNTNGVEGVYRFLGRVWRLFVEEKSETDFEQAAAVASASEHEPLLELIRINPSIQEIPPTPAQLKTLHACIKKVSEDLDGMRFNTAISALMVFVNEAITWEIKPSAVLRTFLQLLSPFSPHLSEELWDRLQADRGATTPSLGYAPWPNYDPSLLVEQTLEIPVQVNGKLRGRIQVPANTAAEELERAALSCETARPFLEGKTVKRIIVVPGKLVNVVAG